MSALSIVTGAGSGLGKAVHEALLAGDSGCISVSRSAPTHDPTRHILADLAHRLHWSALLGPLLSELEFSRICFFDIAAVLPLAAAEDVDFDAKLDRAMQVNVRTPLAIARALLAIARSRGIALEIVHISSGAAHRPVANWGAYCVSKAAAAMAWRVFEAENSEVTARIIQPGVIATAMQAQLRATRDANAAPEDALRSPQEVARDILQKCGLVS